MMSAGWLLVALAVLNAPARAQAPCGACATAPRNDTAAAASIAAEAASLRHAFDKNGAAAFEAKCRENFAATKCDADLAAFVAADARDAVSLFRGLLLETCAAKAATVLEPAAAAKAAEPFVEAEFAAGVDASLARADAAQVDLEARGLLYASNLSKKRLDAVLSGLDTAASVGAARVARFDELRAKEAELARLIAAAEKVMDGNVSRIVKLQDELKALLRAARLDIFMLKSWRRARERFVAVHVAIDALAVNNSALRVDPDAQTAAKRDIRVLLARFCCHDGGQRFQDTLSAFPGLALVKSGTFDHEVMCVSDEIVDATLHGGCRVQMAQLAVETRREFGPFDVFAAREFDFGADVVFDSRNVEIENLDWRAPSEWKHNASASAPGALECGDEHAIAAAIERTCGNFAESKEAAPLFAAISTGEPIADGSPAAAACDALAAYRRCKAAATPAGCAVGERECEKSAHDLRDIGCSACDDSATAAEERELCSAAESNCCGAPGVESGDWCAPQAADEAAIDARVRCIASRAEELDSDEVGDACDTHSAFRHCKGGVQDRAYFGDSVRCQDRRPWSTRHWQAVDHVIVCHSGRCIAVQHQQRNARSRRRVQHPLPVQVFTLIWSPRPVDSRNSGAQPEGAGKKSPSMCQMDVQLAWEGNAWLRSVGSTVAFVVVSCKVQGEKLERRKKRRKKRERGERLVNDAFLDVYSALVALGVRTVPVLLFLVFASVAIVDAVPLEPSQHTALMRIYNETGVASDRYPRFGPSEDCTNVVGDLRCIRGDVFSL